MCARCQSRPSHLGCGWFAHRAGYKRGVGNSRLARSAQRDGGNDANGAAALGHLVQERHSRERGEPFSETHARCGTGRSSRRPGAARLKNHRVCPLADRLGEAVGAPGINWHLNSPGSAASCSAALPIPTRAPCCERRPLAALEIVFPASSAPRCQPDR